MSKFKRGDLVRLLPGRADLSGYNPVMADLVLRLLHLPDINGRIDWHWAAAEVASPIAKEAPHWYLLEDDIILDFIYQSKVSRALRGDK